MWAADSQMWAGGEGVGRFSLDDFEFDMDVLLQVIRYKYWIWVVARWMVTKKKREKKKRGKRKFQMITRPCRS